VLDDDRQVDRMGFGRTASRKRDDSPTLPDTPGLARAPFRQLKE